jgi:enoyl-CoA hydratase/carnithine racemase
MMLDGGPISAEEAHELGIVDELADPGDLLDTAVALAERLGARTKAAIGATKRAVYLGASLPLADGLRVEGAQFMSALGADDAIAAMRAYVEGIERTGELPAYDREAMDAALERGGFA